MSTYVITNDELSLDQLEIILKPDTQLQLSERSIQLVVECRSYLEKKIKNQKDPIYGVNTGFGSLCNHSISESDLGQLQKNLVMSHACGMGEKVPDEIVRIILFLKIQSLSYGNSGIQLSTLNRLIDLYNHQIFPVVYTQGSLGASGDLAPLAHLSLPLLGLGEVKYKGQIWETKKLYQKLGWSAIELSSKEGLAMLNGTQFMSAYGVFILIKAFRLLNWSALIAAMSLDAYDGRPEPFYEQVHLVRRQTGQIRFARMMMQILHESKLIERPKTHVQDPYSFRCIPQVHGASLDALMHVLNVFTNEINAVTDNPTIFPEDDMIISAGNFHGQPLAISLDFMTIALAELGNISERRVYRLISGERKLPSFLIANPGLNSGFMIPQYCAASIVSQNKQYCTPSSVDSIESSQGQEDHVSMGANAAFKALKVLENVETILSVELMNAAQALEFRRPDKSSPPVEKLFQSFRKYVHFDEDDTLMYKEMHSAKKFLQDYQTSKFIKVDLLNDPD